MMGKKMEVERFELSSQPNSIEGPTCLAPLDVLDPLKDAPGLGLKCSI